MAAVRAFKAPLIAYDNFHVKITEGSFDGAGRLGRIAEDEHALVTRQA